MPTDSCKWGRFSRINIKPQFSRVLNRFEFTRPDQVTDVAGSTTVVASMRYLGLGTLVGLNYNNPLFPALRSGPTAVSGASRQKQIPIITVRMAIDSCLATILAREAGLRKGTLTMAELLKENRRMEVNLAGLKDS